MADVRTFRAATMREALDLVREEFGADAVILHTRQVARRRFLPWRKPIEEVEITASLTLEVAPREERTPRKRTQPTAAQPNASEPSDAPKSPAAKPASRGRPPIGRGGLRRFATRPDLRAHRNTRRLAPRSATIARIAASRAPQAPNRRMTKDAPPAESNEQRRPFEALEPAATAQPLHRPADRDQSGVRGRIRPDGRAEPAARRDSTDAARPGPGEPRPRQDEVPPELFQLYTELIDARSRGRRRPRPDLPAQAERPRRPTFRRGGRQGPADGHGRVGNPLLRADRRQDRAAARSSRWSGPRASARRRRSPSWPPISGCAAESRWDSSRSTPIASRPSSSCGPTPRSSTCR